MKIGYLVLFTVLFSCGTEKVKSTNEEITEVVPESNSSVSSTPKMISTENKTNELSDFALSQLRTIDLFKEDKTIPKRELRKVDINLDDSCLIAVMDILTLNSTDSTIYLVNLCNSLKLTELATVTSYPDGSKVTTSKIVGNSIYTNTINSCLGDYVPDEYYEEIIDSIITSYLIVDGGLKPITNDSIRSSVTKKL